MLPLPNPLREIDGARNSRANNVLFVLCLFARLDRASGFLGRRGATSIEANVQEHEPEGYNNSGSRMDDTDDAGDRGFEESDLVLFGEFHSVTSTRDSDVVKLRRSPLASKFRDAVAVQFRGFRDGVSVSGKFREKFRDFSFPRRGVWRSLRVALTAFALISVRPLRIDRETRFLPPFFS